MKKLLLIIAFTWILSISEYSYAFDEISIGDKIGDILYTDIKTYINENRIDSLNINGKTAIVVEDLRNYGFSVIWDNNSRSLFVDYLEKSNLLNNIYENSEKKYYIGQDIGDVLYTDIKAFINGKKIKSFNINGKTAIYVEDLKEILNVSYDDKKRIVNINDKKLLEVNNIGPFQHLKFDAPIYEYNIINQNEFNINGSIIDEKIDESFKLKIEYKNENNQFDLIEEKTVDYDGMTFDYNISLGNKKGIYKITVVVPLTAVNNPFTDIAEFYIEYK